MKPDPSTYPVGSTPSSVRLASSAIRRHFVVVSSRPGVLDTFPVAGSLPRHPLPSTGSAGARSPISSVVWGVPTSRCPSRRTSLPSFGGTVRRSLFAPHGHRAERPHGRGLLTGFPLPVSSRTEIARSPRFLGNPNARVPCSPTPAGPRRPAICGAPVLPSAFFTASAPAKTVLSGLNRTARILAVYASQQESPPDHARLASGGWPAVPGRG